jgi:C-terminal region of Mon2 protein
VATTDVFLQWNISDYFYQNQDKLSNSLNGDEAIFPEFPGTPNMPPFDKLWMCLYARLGAILLQLCNFEIEIACLFCVQFYHCYIILIHKNTWPEILSFHFLCR